MSLDNSIMADIVRYSLKTGEFKLSSGKTSNLYFNIHALLFKSSVFQPLISLISNKILLGEHTYIGGISTGSVPILGALAAHRDAKLKQRFFFVRKNPSTTGMIIEGCNFDKMKKEDSIVLIDDVATTGKTLWKNISLINKLSGRSGRSSIKKVFVVFDRQEGAKNFLADKGVELQYFFNRQNYEFYLQKKEK